MSKKKKAFIKEYKISYKGSEDPDRVAKLAWKLKKLSKKMKKVQRAHDKWKRSLSATENVAKSDRGGF